MYNEPTESGRPKSKAQMKAYLFADVRDKIDRSIITGLTEGEIYMYALGMIKGWQSVGLIDENDASTWRSGFEKEIDGSVYPPLFDDSEEVKPKKKKQWVKFSARSSKTHPPKAGKQYTVLSPSGLTWDIRTDVKWTGKVFMGKVHQLSVAYWLKEEE